MKKALLSLGVLGISLGVSLKLFVDKVDEQTQDAYWQGQVQLAKVNIDRLRLLQAVRCDGMDLGTYFLVKASGEGFEPYVAAIIPQESAGDVYATGCDPCPDSWELTMKRKTHPINSRWLDMVFGQGLHNYCLRKDATRENTCTVGFGLMQITSHTISEGRYKELVRPEALAYTKAHVVKGSGNYAAANEEPKDSPYNPCRNIAVGLSILRDKYDICRRKYGDKTAKTMACAVCYYNGRTDYLSHLRKTVIDRGQAGLLVRAGFIKDGTLEGLRKFLVDIEGFVKRWNEEEKRGKLCTKVF
jgi:hypothetical protein